MTPYPFGSDGNPVDPTSSLCADDSTAFGPNWPGDFNPEGGNIQGNPPCYLQVESMAFRAWNRGIAALRPASASGTIAYGVWLYNGANWFPDPAFPGTGACPGSTVLWAGKLDYWLIGSAAAPQQKLCRFDGANLVWEPLSLPATTLARLPVDSFTGSPAGGITSGGCFAWNNCWFFGTDGIGVHWDGQALTDASTGGGNSPWLEADFTGAVASTDPSGNPFGLAVTAAGSSSQPAQAGGSPLPAQPDGSPPPQLYGSTGGPFSPLVFSPPANAQPNDPYTTDLVAIAADPQADVWVAGDPNQRQQAGPAPLMRLTESGMPVSCTGYDANTFAVNRTSGVQATSFRWTSLSVFGNDGTALAGVGYEQSGVSFIADETSDIEPALVLAACGQPPQVITFRIPDPRIADQATAPLIPADNGGNTAAVAAIASNDAWAATTPGSLTVESSVGPTGVSVKPHLYLFTDGQPPDAPAGDDNESRPTLFTLDAPVYVQAPPTVVQQTTTVTRTTKRRKTRKVKLKSAVYSVHSKLQHATGRPFTLYIRFRVRRPVKLGIEALRGGKVVAFSGVKLFRGHSGTLALRLDPKRWPTRLRFVVPKKSSHP